MKKAASFLSLLVCLAACEKSGSGSKDTPEASSPLPLVADEPPPPAPDPLVANEETPVAPAAPEAAPSPEPPPPQEAGPTEPVMPEPSEPEPAPNAPVPNAPAPNAPAPNAPAPNAPAPNAPAPQAPAANTPAPNAPVPFEALSLKEEQFWVIQKGENGLSFNTPWDAEEGDAIKRSQEEMPAYALSCQEKTKAKFLSLQSRKDLQDRFAALTAAGATSELIYLISVAPSGSKRDDLRRLDRDAYFWHWTDPGKRPSLALSQFTKGVWVWEVLAMEAECIQPDEKEMLRYLSYVESRLGMAAKGVAL